MKKLLFALLMISSFSIFSRSNPLPDNYSNTGDSLKVILGINNIDRNASTNVRSTLNSLTGVTVVAYCDNHSVFMLKVDNTIFRDRNDLMEKLKNVYAKTQDQLSFKDGDFDAFIQYCSPTNVDDAANLKKLIH